MIRATLTLTVILALGFVSPASAALERIGAAGGVSGKVVALAPEAGAAGRVMGSGKTVYHLDKVSTDARGRMQVLLLDQTTFTIGPDTELILDEFVYDPFTDSGKVGVQVTKGVFRFVSGKIARKEPDAMKIKLPVGTIGIRGTIGAASTDGSSAVAALIGPGPNNNADEKPGAITVTNAGVTQTITRQGYYCEIPGPDQPPTPPAPMTPEVAAKVDPKPAAAAGGGEEPGGGATATQASGEQTAAAQGDLQSTQSTGLLASGFDNTTSAAGQDSAENSGSFSWESFRSLVPASGTGFYSGSSVYTCSGGPCGGSGSGDWTIHFHVDWGARTLGGFADSSHFAFKTGTGGPLCPAPCSSEFESQIPVTSFAALSGTAKLTQGTNFSGTNSEFNGSSFEFTDAKHFKGTLNYSATSGANAGASASGTLTGTCSSGCP